MFEVHQDDILVIEGAKFNDNLNYLLSMGKRGTFLINKSKAEAKREVAILPIIKPPPCKALVTILWRKY
jgi:hypothetical protein